MVENDEIDDEIEEEETTTSSVKYNGIELYNVVSRKTKDGKWDSELELIISDTELDDLVRDLPLEIKADLKEKAYPVFVAMERAGLDPREYALELTDHKEFVEYALDNHIKNKRQLRNFNPKVYQFARDEGCLNYLFPYLHSAEEVVGKDLMGDNLSPEMPTPHEYDSEEEEESILDV